MQTIDGRRRHFLLGAGGSLMAAGAVSGVTLTARPALGADPEVITQTQAKQAATTPAEALRMLREGNARFVQGNILRRNLKRQVKATAENQFPFAAIVGCIDSRASNELIFDQGIGDLFSARIAGNFVNDEMLGSLEFACALSGAKLIVVMGHSECGAIKGACDDVVFGNLTHTLAHIKPAVAAVPGHDGDRSSGNSDFVQAVAVKNVELTLEKIRERSPVLRDMIDSGKIGLVGAMYDVHNGQVVFN